MLDGVAVIDDRNRQLDQARIGLQQLVAAYGDLNLYEAVVAVGIVERDRLMFDRPLAHSEVGDDQKRGQRKQNGNSTFHLFLGATLLLS